MIDKQVLRAMKKSQEFFQRGMTEATDETTFNFYKDLYNEVTQKLYQLEGITWTPRELNFSQRDVRT